MLNAIVWNISPDLFSKGFLNLRWYNLLFVTGILVGLPIWYHMFTTSVLPKEEADQIKIYIILSILIGARLGHVIFYDWNYYKHNILEIFLPITLYPSFKITGFSGLASHGAAIGIIIAVFLYVRKLNICFFPPRIYFKNNFSYRIFLWILDRLVIVVALGGSLIRIGNFMNSEIIGKPTGSNYGIVFIRELHNNLYNRFASKIDTLTIHKASTSNILPIKNSNNHQPIELSITFKKKISDEIFLKNFLEKFLKNFLIQEAHFRESPNIYETYGTPLSYTLEKKNEKYQAKVYTWGIPRHPAQLYESFSCFLIFILFFIWWKKKDKILSPGRILGFFMVIVFLLRFLYEFYKENQVSFENTMCLNMGQVLSLPFIIVGLFLIFNPKIKSEYVK